MNYVKTDGEYKLNIIPAEEARKIAEKDIDVDSELKRISSLIEFESNLGKRVLSFKVLSTHVKSVGKIVKALEANGYWVSRMSDDTTLTIGW